ncbi:conserved membrane hypothetical protein [uncultured Paludibacter sp.]|uniref:DUF1361 domain-containing protein n=1 Tax=uncultured Paludibacter sp. TaxID=497635 RepID=A0A653ACR9_9BACT|nr:conserved membrane hypothetical protein [uncultured Paludibacter sp.]
MFKALKQHNRLNESTFLILLSLFCFFSSIFRFIYSDSKLFLFLNWNLFLAFLPWFLTSIAIIYPNLQKKRFFVAVLLLVWLLFFPNAPYILTDLFHLRLYTSVPIWFDLILILSFAWGGLLFGFLSLWDIENILSKFINKKWIIASVSVFLLFLGSFGIYIGRYLRWNSWDIITEPFKLIYDIGDRIVNPFSHPRTWGMTIFMGIFLNILYWSFKMIKSRE